MNALFVEDDEHKMLSVVGFLKSHMPNLNVNIARSVQGGLRYFSNSTPDVVILDMSLPVFDYSVSERGYKHLPFGGREILEHLDNMDIITPVIVLTAFEQYGSGTTAVTLKELHNELLVEFPENYVGSVWYSALEDKWQDDLLIYLDKSLNK